MGQDQPVEEVLATLGALPSLSLLNICDTLDTLSTRASLQATLDPDDTSLWLEPYNREILLLQAVIDGDVVTSRRYVSDGVDIDFRLGPWAAATLHRSWKERCNYQSQKFLVSPYFNCAHKEERLRPRLVHIAVMFNSGQILADLVTLGADLKGVVWFGDVFEYEVPNGPDGVPDPSETCGMSTVEGKVLKPDEDALEDWEEKFKGIMENKWKEEGLSTTRGDEKIKKKRAHVYTGLGIV